jgi:NAD-dependent dihydropyrimidine dehydrogenase PreA subunit
MPHVIVDACTKDFACLDSCPTGCIAPAADDPKVGEVTQVYINPEECLDCGACVSACPSDAIFPADGLPEGKQDFAEKNAAFFRK